MKNYQRSTYRLLAVLLRSLSPAVSHAAEFTQPLPGLVENYEFPESLFFASAFDLVDFGQSFPAIESIEVEFTASATQGEADFGVGSIGPFDPEVRITVGSASVDVGRS
ncbi:MAG: hypothetical protein AAGA92_14965 [Planctomycetota bacterium]